MALSWGDLRNSFFDEMLIGFPLIYPKARALLAVLNGGLDLFKFALTVNSVAVGHGLGGCHVAEVWTGWAVVVLGWLERAYMNSWPQGQAAVWQKEKGVLFS